MNIKAWDYKIFGEPIASRPIDASLVTDTLFSRLSVILAAGWHYKIV